MSKENYEHKLYKYVKDDKDADAIAWAFVNPEKMVRFPFKFPPLEPGEIRANVLYAGLCQSDVHTVKGHWGQCSYPLAPGHEIIGEVSEVGKDVKDFKKGDLVGFGTMRDVCEKCKFCKIGKEELCRGVEEPFTYGFHWGGYATALQQPAKLFFHLPKGFNLARGAPLFCAGITVFYPMKKFLKPGMKCAVIGIGGLGHLALQFLNKLGHEVAAFTTSPNKAESIKKLGANQVIISTDPAQMKAAESKFDFIVNTIPSIDENFFQNYFNCIDLGGTFVQVGQPDFDHGKLKFSVWDFVCKEVNLVGSCVGPRPVIKEMLPVCVEKDIYPICEEFKFEDFPKAFEKLEKGKPHFRCVVNVKEYAEKHGFKK